ncbi:hypothetical protein AALD01_03425 [Oscillospiraceae bacterium 21-37]
MFQWILEEAGSAGALTPAAVFIDGTHIKANTNLKKKMKREVSAAAKRYQEELLAEVNADREAHGKKAGFKTVAKSTTDSDCGVFMKGKHQRQVGPRFFPGI